MVQAGLRTLQVVAAAAVLVALSVRFTKRYRPRQAGGTAAALFSRKA